MSNVLVINFLGEGHVNPLLAVVSELIQRGDSVVSYCIEDYRKKIETTGAEFRSFENFFSQINFMERVHEESSPITMLSHIVEATERIATQIIEETKGEKYDYMIYDNHFPVGRMIANILQLPSVASCPTFALNQYVTFNAAQKSKQIDETDPLYQFCLTEMERWTKQYGMKFNSLYDIMNHPGDITIVYTSKEYQPYSDTFDPSYKFVGPSITTRKEVGDFPIEDLKNKKVIFISMGTVFNEQPGLYEKCFEAFKDIEAIVILVVGKKININQFENIPSNFKLYNYVPQLEVLKHTDIFVTHGGMNSSSEALYYDVPLVVIPVTGDQPLVAKRVTEMGAGIRLNRKELTSKLLREAVQTIINDVTFKENSHKVGKSLRDAGGYKKATEEIIKFMSNHQTSK
ncbi:macrolide family glycosyltransferase [Bacillus cereus group sp. N21]|uniref:macrolide family glycosyltransferase n=1 Tax=Bacillus cereus group sp. N21 TaxID=2794591 RepID=UPI0018F5C8D2|nr:macrolide family glycosyltransferase [Bacillus cereus group sp. N21]MBJ8031673.1 glycosyl transferase [Bacillus cereus group sp. N21]